MPLAENSSDVDSGSHPRCTVWTDARFLDHRTGAHPETHRRLTAIDAQLQTLFPLAGAVWEQPNLPEPITPAENAAIEAVHPRKYLFQLEQFAAHGGGNWDGDTVVCPDSFDVAVHASRAAIQLTNLVLAGETKTGLLLARPPGHHATNEQAMGFCLLNHIAVAARMAVQTGGCKRVLIIDWDVHHGNGTEAIFADDPAVWFFSAHRSPFYPGTGARDFTGTGKGVGTIRNLPLPAETSREEYIAAFQKDVADFAEQCQPELILISAGFDAHRLDPIGSLNLETDDFTTLTQIVRNLADRYCSGRIVSLLEGGYHLEMTAASVAAHIRALAEDHQP